MSKRPYEAPRITGKGTIAGSEWRQQSPFPLLLPERLAELAELAAAKRDGATAEIAPVELAELVRLYVQISGVADALLIMDRLETELKAQVQIAERIVDSVLRGARNRFSVLLQWVSANPSIVHTKWHQSNDLRWAGTFDEAAEIVRTQYGPRRGVQAFVVVQLDD